MALTARRRVTVLLMVGVVALVAGAVYVQQRGTLPVAQVRPTSEPPWSNLGTDAGNPETPVSPVTFTVLGDALSEEPAGGEGWVARFAEGLCWSLVDRLAGSSSGFTDRAVTDPPTDTSFSAQVGEVIAKRPRVVIVQGGATDVQATPEAITAAATGLFSSLRSGLGDDATIVAVGPMATPFIDAPSLAPAAAAIALTAAQFGVTFVDPLAQRWLVDPGSFEPDGRLPSEQGFQEVANRLVAAFKEPGTVPTSSCR